MTTTTPAKKFKMANQKIMLTYRTHLNKTEYIEWFSNQCMIPKFIRCAHENGINDPETPYEHTHVLIDFGKAVQYTNPRKFDYLEIHPHIQIVGKQPHWDNSIIYIAKEDPENADLLIKKTTLADAIWSANTIGEVLQRFAYKPSDAPGLIVMFNNKPQNDNNKYLIPEENFYPWQIDILNILKKTPNDRNVYWIYDKKGKTGKSKLSKHLISLNKDTYKVSNTGGIRDFSTIISNALASGWTGRNFIIDLPRKAEAYDISPQIEDIKNGCITSTKYSGKTEIFDTPHVIIFANFLPIIGELSLDRWKIKIIDNKTKAFIKFHKQNCVTYKGVTEVNPAGLLVHGEQVDERISAEATCDCGTNLNIKGLVLVDGRPVWDESMLHDNDSEKRKIYKKQLKIKEIIRIMKKAGITKEDLV